MALKAFQDPSGHSIEIFEWNGHYLPYVLNGLVKQENLIEYMNDGSYSEDDIVLCSYPRSGTHWLYENVNMLVTKTLTVTKRVMLDYTIEFKALRNYVPLSGPHIHHTHLTPDVLPRRLHNAKIIYMYRNPKDVAWSYYNFSRSALNYNGTFEDYVECFLNGIETFGSWFDHVLHWESFAKEKNICVVAYEDMSKKPVETVKRLAAYLEVDVDQNSIESVTKACHIDNMRNKKACVDGQELATIVRKGVVGAWKDHFTVALSEKFDRVFNEKMERSKLHFRFDKE